MIRKLKWLISACVTSGFVLVNIIIPSRFVDNRSVSSTYGLQTARQVNHRKCSNSLPSFFQPGVGPIPYDFRYANKNFCSTRQSLSYIIYVFSAPNHTHYRQRIRNTWGIPNIINGFYGKTVFMIGQTKDMKQQGLVRSEMKRFGDIVVGDFLDTYENITYKGLMALQWIVKYCNNARFVIKADDDVMVNIFRLRDFLDKRVAGMKRTIFCRLNPFSPVMRKGKYKVAMQQYPLTQYPKYCNGPSWILTNDSTYALLNVSIGVAFLPVEDVYTSGLLTLAAKIHHRESEEFDTFVEKPRLSWYGVLKRIPLFSLPTDSIYNSLWSWCLCNLHGDLTKTLNKRFIKSLPPKRQCNDILKQFYT